MPSAADQLRRALVAQGGAVRFDEYMAIALYGEDGFYTRTTEVGRAGRRGDFLTSAEVGPLFGAVIARAIDAWWEELGRPHEFTVVDAGAGPGTLARAVLAAKPACSDALRYVAVEVSAAQRELHPSGIDSRAEMPTEAFVGVILANELLDNLPFRLFVFDDSWREAHVGMDGDRYVEVLRACADVPACLVSSEEQAQYGASPQHGARVAVQERAAQWVSNALGLLQAGRLVVFDYATTTESMIARPWREWLRTYAQHSKGAHYLSAPGDQDITVDVAIDQLPTPNSVITQAEFLRAHGCEMLVDEGRRAWSAAAQQPDLQTMLMRSRIREAEALLDPAGLGGFSVLEWRR